MTNPPDTQEYEDLKAKEFVLPFGESVRTLLKCESSSDVLIKQLAFRKGFFSKSRNNDVFFLSCAMLTASEFERIEQEIFYKESKKRFRHAEYELDPNSDTSWTKCIEDLRSDFEEFSSASTENESYTFIQPIEFTRDKNSCTIEYEINSLDLSANYVRSSVPHKGKIVIEEDPSRNILDITIVDDNKDIVGINKKILKAIGKKFKSEKCVVGKIKSIKFGDFPNRERVTFLLKMTAPVFGQNKSKVSSLSFYINKDIKNSESDDNIKWLTDAASRVHLSGESINKVLDLIHSKYFDYFFIREIGVQYCFADPNTGELLTANCSLEFASNSRSHIDEKSNFSSSVITLTGKTISRADLRNQLEKELKKRSATYYNEIMESVVLSEKT
ncbi:hypothetical protein M8O52_09090 [Akkermansia muciniphila]|uniref:hypothetical protein n=1 Tax=Akkermansia muciniphila TaxID=239935 RepID=UPI00201D5707|nr:hypothetical protein [Akkermansia muciniphila]MCL6677188.1 hypothetical protein [Akkermansia muciniphila]